MHAFLLMPQLSRSPRGQKECVWPGPRDVLSGSRLSSAGRSRALRGWSAALAVAEVPLPAPRGSPTGPSEAEVPSQGHFSAASGGSRRCLACGGSITPASAHAVTGLVVPRHGSQTCCRLRCMGTRVTSSRTHPAHPGPSPHFQVLKLHHLRKTPSAHRMVRTVSGVRV